MFSLGGDGRVWSGFSGAGSSLQGHPACPRVSWLPGHTLLGRGREAGGCVSSPACLPSALSLWPQQTEDGSLSTGQGRSRTSRKAIRASADGEDRETERAQRPRLLPSPEPSEAGASGRLLLTRPPHHSLSAGQPGNRRSKTSRNSRDGNTASETLSGTAEKQQSCHLKASVFVPLQPAFSSVQYAFSLFWATLHG